MKTHRLGRDREAKDTITKRLNMKILSDTTDHRLQKSSYCGLRQSELTAAKGDDQEEFTRGESRIETDRKTKLATNFSFHHSPRPGVKARESHTSQAEETSTAAIMTEARRKG